MKIHSPFINYIHNNGWILKFHCKVSGSTEDRLSYAGQENKINGLLLESSLKLFLSSEFYTYFHQVKTRQLVLRTVTRNRGRSGFAHAQLASCFWGEFAQLYVRCSIVWEALLSLLFILSSNLYEGGWYTSLIFSKCLWNWVRCFSLYENKTYRWVIMTGLVQMELQSVKRDYITQLNRDVFSLWFSRAVLLAVLHRHTLIIQTDFLLPSFSLSVSAEGRRDERKREEEEFAVRLLLLHQKTKRSSSSCIPSTINTHAKIKHTHRDLSCVYVFVNMYVRDVTHLFSAC